MNIAKAVTALLQGSTRQAVRAVDELDAFQGYAVIRPETRAHLAAMLDRHLNRPEHWRSDFARCCYAASLLAQRFDGRGGRHFRTAFEASRELRHRHQLLWSAIRAGFVTGTDLRESLFPMHFALQHDCRQLLPLQARPAPAANRHCGILTSQFLAPPHAPSTQIVGLCDAVSRRGYQPFVIDIRDIPNHYDLPLHNAFQANHLTSRSGLQAIRIDERTQVLLCTVTAPMPSAEGLHHAIDFIDRVRPELVLSYGAYNCMTEIVAERYRTVLVPSSRRLQPTRRCAASVIWSEPDDADRALSDAFELSSVPLIPVTNPSALRAIAEGTPLARNALSLEPGDFVVAIASNRLDADLSTDCLRLLQSIARRATRPARFVFAGDCPPETAQRVRASLGEDAVRFPGFVDELAELFRICDVYLNPPRVGGGFTAAIALYAGLPVYTVGGGDAANYALGDNVAGDLDTLAALVMREADPVFNAASRAQSMDRYRSFSTDDQLMERIFSVSGL